MKTNNKKPNNKTGMTEEELVQAIANYGHQEEETG